MNTSDTIKFLLYPLVVLVRALRAYRYLKNWRRYLVDGYVTLRLDMPKGIFTLDIRSALSSTMFIGSYEKGLMSLVSSLHIGKGLILNIGANIGFYAVHLANSFPQNTVVAIEPNPEAYGFLAKNIEQNGLNSKVRTINACVGSEKGTVKFSVLPGKSEYSSINGIVSRYTGGKEQRVIDVDCYSLSDIVGDEKVSLIVMDVEGAEYIVLNGGKKIITRDEPIILCECSEVMLNKFGHTSALLIDFLRECGYRVKDASNLHKTPKPPFNGNILSLGQQSV